MLSSLHTQTTQGAKFFFINSPHLELRVIGQDLRSYNNFVPFICVHSWLLTWSISQRNKGSHLLDRSAHNWRKSGVEGHWQLDNSSRGHCRLLASEQGRSLGGKVRRSRHNYSRHSCSPTFIWELLLLATFDLLFKLLISNFKLSASGSAQIIHLWAMIVGFTSQRSPVGKQSSREGKENEKHNLARLQLNHLDGLSTRRVSCTGMLLSAPPRSHRSCLPNIYTSLKSEQWIYFLFQFISFIHYTPEIPWKFFTLLDFNPAFLRKIASPHIIINIF